MCDVSDVLHRSSSFSIAYDSRCTALGRDVAAAVILDIFRRDRPVLQDGELYRHRHFNIVATAGVQDVHVALNGDGQRKARRAEAETGLIVDLPM